MTTRAAFPPSVKAEHDPREDLLVAAVTATLSRRSDSPAFRHREFLLWLHEAECINSANRECPSATASAFACRVAHSLSGRRVAGIVIHGCPELRAAVQGMSASDLVRESATTGLAPFLDFAVAAGAGRELWDAECENCVVIPASLPPGPYVALKVSGESMEPVLHQGDVILVRVGSPILPNRMVVARSDDDGYVVKRVQSVRRSELILDSLNPAFGSVRISRRGNAVLGPVVLRWCVHDRSHPGSRITG